MANTTTQVKFTIESSIVAAFKAKCADEGVSMTSAIRHFMKTCQPTREIKPKTLNRQLRKKIVIDMIHLLNDVLSSEAEYRDAIPEQFTQRYEAADHACEQFEEAIAYLEEAF